MSISTISSNTNIGANAAKRFMEINNKRAVRATEELASGIRASNPAYDPSAASVGYTMTGNIQSLNQASRNVSQASAMIQLGTGFLGETANILTRLKELTVASNTDSVGSTERSMFQQEFDQLINQVDVNATSARFGGISLFTGGAGTATHSGAVAADVGGLNASVNAFAGTLNAASQGMISGVATAATVKANGSHYDVTVTVGNQVFKATVAAPVAGGTLSLVSTTDAANVIVLDYDGADVSAISDAETFQSALKEALGIDATSGTTATFYSLSSDAAAITGGDVTLAAGPGTAAGLWALSYTGTAAGGVGTFKITNGTEVYTQTITTAASNIGQVLTFRNGMTLTLSNAFDGTANLAQEIFDVSAGTGLVQNFQYGEKSSDVLSVKFNGATASALGLSGLSILTREEAAIAVKSIDAALTAVGLQIAELGGKYSQFQSMTETLRVNVQNQTAARATFLDADIAESMSALQRNKGLLQVASTVFSQALNAQNELTQMVQSIR